MKKILLGTLLFVLLAAQTNPGQLTKQDRKFGVKYLTETKKNFLKAVKGLSEAQLNFKPTPEQWSIAECAEHIALSETLLWDLDQSLLKKPADPAKRAEVKVDEAKIIAMLTNRSQKAKAPERLQPTRQFATTAQAVAKFTQERDKIIAYLKTTQDPLRHHFGQYNVGTIDAYQGLVLLAAHGQRHVLQIL
ncbi:MAG: DinB family protein, partial [Bernardetiaceae bacterium]|nr:DinB family protein [Bernardetiaceae bacterium]